MKKIALMFAAPLLLLTLSGCGTNWAIVYRDNPNGTLRAIADDTWTFREAQATAARMEGKGYAVKGSALVLTHYAAITMVEGK